ncbi:TetR/AcrR family transcriptional regulator [Microbispora sp. SCL1-1]|uniref:TetR/AcrR family transcriptional regulator n=1 Tax=Microbispora TaxID=2005 RepID=UPI0011572FC8|nr:MULTISPECIES: TetR/AcrR family transcriptional regulator [unclassified Microbispora]NJP23667.1 TetR/AcrR family transcriptional regulator [Microbispora sp. CL1-1]TQS15880.1 TetR/AcrR family transcriptional regulator [Microbispora sp. SCL1-1]
MSSRDGAVGALLAAEPGRTPRADARRNMERLVEAARAAVAETGIEVTAHEIARRAGVGIGTFYRRVSSREALLEAVLDEVLAEMADLAANAAADPDPWHAFETFAATYVRLRAESCGIREAVGGACGPNLDPVLGEIQEGLRLLVERAQKAGVMRADVAWQDVPFLLAAVATGPRTLRLRAGDEQWGRNLRVVLDGLRTPGTQGLPGTPPA